MFDNKKKKIMKNRLKWDGKEKDLKNPERVINKKIVRKRFVEICNIASIYEQTKTFKIIFVLCKFLK